MVASTTVSTSPVHFSDSLDNQELVQSLSECRFITLNHHLLVKFEIVKFRIKYLLLCNSLD